MRSIAAFTLLGLTSVASAQPSATPPAPPPLPPVAAAAETDASRTTDVGVLEDANAGHAFLAPTALTMPASSWSFSDDELLFAGLAYGATDRLQLGFTFLLPVINEAPTIAVANAKFQLLRAGNLRGALTGAAIYFSENIDGGENVDYDDSTKLLSIGAALTMCVDDDCHSHVTASGSAAFGTEREETRTTYVASASAVMRVARLVKLVFEVDRGFMGDEMDVSFGTLAWYGARFTSRNIGVDLGFVKNVCNECDDEFQMGFPFVSFTYRGMLD